MYHQLFIIPCLYVGAYHLLGEKKSQIFEMNSKKKILEVPPFTTEKRTMLAHSSQRDTPACQLAHTRSMHIQPSSLHVLWSWERSPFQVTGAIILCNKTVECISTIRRKITDITNAANTGIWHSEHAKKLTLINCHIVCLLKKRSLHILKFNGPRESWSALSFLLLASDDL